MSVSVSQYVTKGPITLVTISERVNLIYSRLNLPEIISSAQPHLWMVTAGRNFLLFSLTVSQCVCWLWLDQLDNWNRQRNVLGKSTYGWNVLQYYKITKLTLSATVTVAMLILISGNSFLKFVYDYSTSDSANLEIITWQWRWSAKVVHPAIECCDRVSCVWQSLNCCTPNDVLSSCAQSCEWCWPSWSWHPVHSHVSTPENHFIVDTATLETTWNNTNNRDEDCPENNEI